MNITSDPVLLQQLEEQTTQLKQMNQRLQKEICERQAALRERQQTEKNLQTNVEQLQLILDLSKTGWWDWNIATDEVIWNDNHFTLLGLKPNSIKPTYQTWRDRVHPEDIEQVEQVLSHALETHTDYKTEYRVVYPDGSLHWVIARGRGLYDESGRQIRMMGILLDITEKKQLEQQFLRVQRLESLGILASGIAHDLNNILTPILAATQLLPLKLPNLDEDSRQLIKLQEINTKHGAELIKQILSFARGTEEKRIPVQVAHLLQEVVKIVKRTFPKSIEVDTDIPSNLWTISADATQLHQVLINLAVNARDAMPDGGILSISANNLFVDESFARMHIEAKVGHYIVITIADTGVGISKNHLDRIFDPFFTTKEASLGTGLGLSTALGIVKSHGGFIDVFTQVEGGSQFKVYLPGQEGLIPPSTQPPELHSGKAELILVVDDEAAIREIAKNILKTHNYRVLTAKDGIDAIALYVQYQTEISLVLMDTFMPSMDGLTAIRILQKLAPQIKIIAMSGLYTDDDRDRLFEVGIQKFLLKPFTAEELLNFLRDELEVAAVDRR